MLKYTLTTGDASGCWGVGLLHIVLYLSVLSFINAYLYVFDKLSIKLVNSFSCFVLSLAGPASLVIVVDAIPLCLGLDSSRNQQLMRYSS